MYFTGVLSVSIFLDALSYGVFLPPVTSSPSPSTASLPRTASTALPRQFVRIGFLLRERTVNAYGKF